MVRLRIPNWLCRIFFDDSSQENNTRIEEINDIIAVCRTILNAPDQYLIFDAETTGLGNNDIIIQLALMDMKGNEVIHTNVRSIHDKRIPKEATAIHGITNQNLKHAPNFTDIVEEIYKLSKTTTFLIFNAEFDNRMLYQTCIHNKVPTFKIKALCVQKLYSIYVGEWSDYFRDFKKQSLPHSSHNAFKDCQSTLRLIREIARNNYLSVPKEEYKLFGVKLN